MYEGTVSGFLVGEDARVQVVCRGVGTCISPGFGSTSTRKAYVTRQATPFTKKQGLGLGFSGLRGRYQVTGSLRVTGDGVCWGGGAGGRGGSSLSGALGRGGSESVIHLGT